MRRRDFLGLIGAVAMWPRPALAQEQVRRIGIIMAIAESDPQVQRRMGVLKSGLKEKGWIEGRNLRIELRVGPGADNMRRNIASLIALKPDVLFSAGTASMAMLARTTRSIPVVFVNVADPVGAGYVESLAHPGGNATGFLQSEYSLSGKWPELLKQIAPDMKRVAVLRDPTLTSGIGQFAVIQAVAPSLGLDVRPVDSRTASGFERGITAFAQSGGGGLIITAGASSNVNRVRIIDLANRYKLPAIYAQQVYVRSGGLMAYSANLLEQYRLAAGYLDPILRGTRPADLPVQAPTKYELAINRRAAKSAGISIPSSLLARADNVID
jgi:putative ABC transport system substrate-binding protein